MYGLYYGKMYSGYYVKNGSEGCRIEAGRIIYEATVVVQVRDDGVWPAVVVVDIKRSGQKRFFSVLWSHDFPEELYFHYFQKKNNADMQEAWTFYFYCL